MKGCIATTSLCLHNRLSYTTNHDPRGDCRPLLLSSCEAEVFTIHRFRTPTCGPKARRSLTVENTEPMSLFFSSKTSCLHWLKGSKMSLRIGSQFSTSTWEQRCGRYPQGTSKAMGVTVVGFTADDDGIQDFNSSI